MKLNIAVLAGDGIGPEIMQQGVAVVKAVAERFAHDVSFTPALCGAAAIDRVGNPFPEETFTTCMNADAVLFAAVGDPKFDTTPQQRYARSRGCSPCASGWGSLPTYGPCRLSQGSSTSRP